MPKSPSAPLRTIADIDREIAVADAERVQLAQRAQRFRNVAEGGSHGLAKQTALLAAWYAQRDVEVLQLERATLDLLNLELQRPPSEAEIAELSRTLDETKAAYHAARGGLFRATDAVREYERRSVERQRNLSRIEHELQETYSEIARRESALDDLERQQALSGVQAA